MPQFNTIWFVSQIFWFSLAFGGFSLICFNIIVPVIVNLQISRKKYIDAIIFDANNLLQQAKKIKQNIDEKIHLAKNESNVILHKAKKNITDNNNNFNNQITNDIIAYYDAKMLQIKQKIEFKKSIALKSIESISNKIGNKAGILNFDMNLENIQKIKDNLNHF
jgi:F0F1-type ATP synthase membrane subunit b/b'